MNKKIARLLEPSLRLYFAVFVCLAVVSAFFNIYLAAVEAVLLVVLYLYFRSTNIRRRKEILKYIESVTYDVDSATKDTMLNSPIPMVIFKPESDEIIWSNDWFLQITGEREHLFETKITDAVPSFSSRWLMEGKSESPAEVELRGKKYRVYGYLAHTEPSGSARGLVATTYWIDITDLSSVRSEYVLSRPVAAIILLDNYEDLMKNISDNSRSSILARIDDKLNTWAAPAHGLLCRYDRDRYIFVFEERHLSSLISGKISLLDSVREVVSSDGVPATISIGAGKDAGSFDELFRYAALSIEMALSRGGDQAVVKNRFHFEFYGGRSKELEKRTKVKSRVMANVLGELVSDSSQVFVMGHKFADLDSVGAAAGICCIARKKKIPVHIVTAPEETLADAVIQRLVKQPEYAGVFVTAQDAILSADSSSLLVVVDTNRPEQVQSEDLLLSCNRVAVIDHHRRAATYIGEASLNFHEPYASSACELVTELLQYLVEPTDILRVEAEALLAGIVLDTKNFTTRTGGRTFDAAAFLRRSGADTAEVKKLFQSDLASMVARYDIIRAAKMYRSNIAIAALGSTVGRIAAAQAADELLTIAGTQASFVLFPVGDSVIISARSMGDINVQVILEDLGGGGNAATAGAQIPDKTVEQVLPELHAAIDRYFEDA
ncbi:DHH family phosphoesterase [Papillibacter cinnamivorans]|uniref:Cyclic-di-AMP phosphodiesterase n=1 Tax=Papillibacter cinnamivorans DSM 12816 TaxID=1122930 RepID=A0A1W2CZ69_9FIRM|nr:DHH family phosphoesterase [Papillibacter cinnamivorans]SMC90615.1 c-di-AMP phosphodiesterase, consists of a GGDEF-like and DHH domains [Papillibacter cinnamivorans DSM 12816]